MRHGFSGRQLSRNTDQRKQLFRIMLRNMVLNGKIRTTLAKAKALQPKVDRLITRAKTNSVTSRRSVESMLADKHSMRKVMADAQTRFAGRTSGFTRIVKLGKRAGDATEEALLTFVDEDVVVETVTPKKTKAAPKKATPRRQDSAGQAKKETKK